MSDLPIQTNQNNNQPDRVKLTASEDISGDKPPLKKSPSDSQPKIEELKENVYPAVSSSDSLEIKPQKTDFEIPKTKTSPVIDGTLDDECWKNAAVLSGFVSENTGEIVKDQTKVYATYDDENIYFGFECSETDISKLRYSQKVKDRIHFDDIIGILVDTLNDGKGLYGFYVTPLGTQGDKSTRDTNWDYDWKSAAKIHPDKWTVEAAIPLRGLRMQDKDKQDWRINFVRIHKNLVLDSIWSYQGVNFSKDPLYFPKLKNLSISIKNKPEFIGYSVFNSQKDEPVKTYGGLDIKYPLTRQLKSNVTINPDFSEVEADEQTTAPQQFERFYPENRPFFKEGSEFFTQSVHGNFNLFHSRNIPRVDAGAKISGKIGNLATGILYTQSPGERQDKVAKLKYSFGDNVDIGAMAVEKKDQTGVSKSTAFEGRIRFNKNLTLDGLVSNTNNPDSNSQTDNQGSLINLSYLTDNVGMSLGFTDIEKNFNPPDGYVRMKDIKGLSGACSYFRSFDTGPIIGYDISFYGSDYKTHQGQPYYKSAGFGFGFENRKNQYISYGYGESTLQNLKSHNNYFTIGLNSNNQNSTWLGYSKGTFENNPSESYGISTGVPLSEKLKAFYSLESSRFTQDQVEQKNIYHRIDLSYEFDKKNTLGVQGRIDQNRQTNLYAAYRKRMGTYHDLYILFGHPNAPKTQYDLLIKYSFPLGK